MSDSWDDRRKALEDGYFEKQNREALARLKNRKEQPRPSPITGKPMEQLTLMGVVVDRCVDSGGIWLDHGELEQIIEASEQKPGEKRDGVLRNFLEMLRPKV